MPLRVGSRLGPYEVTAKLGEGGMGEVYRAIDARLNRQVALKILPEAVAADAERISRFRREAQILASLNHPGIAAIYNIEDADGMRALVLELVDGPTLADRIARGPVPWHEALPIAEQIARALEAAHDAGVIHRDLKPANIKVRNDGTVKILDFGLAKVLSPETGDSSDSPTADDATRPNVMLGTSSFMSPEQALGSRVDKRTDIWAFGCCLYEMLSGRRAFKGASREETLARIFSDEPDWTALPADIPRAVRELLWRCLRKDRRERLRDIGDARFERLTVDAGSGTAESPEVPLRHSISPWVLASSIAAAMAMTSLAFLLYASWNAPAPGMAGSERRTSILIRDADAYLDGPTGVVISPDGRTLAFLARNGGQSHIRVRPLNRSDSRALPGTENAVTMFFSPDSRSLGFYAVDDRAVGAIKRVSLAEGHVQQLCDAREFFGGSWAADNSIVFAGPGGLFRVPAAGGTPQPVSTVETAQGEFSHRYPHVLPDGRRVLFTIGTGGDFDSARIAVLHLDTGHHQTILQDGSSARYLASGHLAYVAGGTLRVALFDLNTLQVGPSIRLAEPIRTDSLLGSAGYSVSSTGTLVYAPFDPSSSQARRLLWVDEEGRERTTGLEGLRLQSPRLSPDGQRAAVVVTQGSKNDIWIYDLERPTPAGYRLTTEGNNINPVWSADGRWIYFGSDRGGTFNLFRQVSDQGAAEQILDSREFQQLPTSWSPDGSLVFNRYDRSNNVDIWLLLPGAARETRPFLTTPFTEGAGVVSPDGRWITYVSDRTGRYEVYLSAFPEGGREVPVSSRGGQEPAWSSRGDRIFYRRDQSMISVSLSVTPSLVPGSEAVLFDGPFSRRNPREYDVSGDDRFLLLQEMTDGRSSVEITIVDGWFSELERLFSASRNSS